MPGCGILFVATGRFHLEEAFISAGQVARWMPGYPIHLYTDRDLVDAARASGRFREVNVIEDGGASEGNFRKIPPLWASPFQKTLFLDSDTYMCRDCSDIFLMLDRYDVAVVHDPWRSEYSFEDSLGLPRAWPTFNTGVIGYRSGPELQEFLRRWHAEYRDKFRALQSGSIQDQPAFRFALYHSRLQVYVLPPEYNLRIYHPVCIGGHSGPAILHDHNPHLRWLAKALSRGRRPRVFGMADPWLTLCYWTQKIRNVIARWMGSRSRTKGNP